VSSFGERERGRGQGGSLGRKVETLPINANPPRAAPHLTPHLRHRQLERPVSTHKHTRSLVANSLNHATFQKTSSSRVLSLSSSVCRHRPRSAPSSPAPIRGGRRPIGAADPLPTRARAPQAPPRNKRERAKAKGEERRRKRRTRRLSGLRRRNSRTHAPSSLSLSPSLSAPLRAREIRAQGDARRRARGIRASERKGARRETGFAD
jgi:hypothetical protein